MNLLRRMLSLYSYCLCVYKRYSCILLIREFHEMMGRLLNGGNLNEMFEKRKRKAKALTNPGEFPFP